MFLRKNDFVEKILKDYRHFGRRDGNKHNYVEYWCNHPECSRKCSHSEEPIYKGLAGYIDCTLYYLLRSTEKDKSAEVIIH